MFLVHRILEINDSFWLHRMEYLVGYGRPYDLTKEHTLNTIDQEVNIYSSTIENIFPVECILTLPYISRATNQLSAINILVELLGYICR